MDMFKDVKPSTKWIKQYRDGNKPLYSIEVNSHTVGVCDSYNNDLGFRWCVYITLKKGSPLEKEGILPWHYGETYRRDIGEGFIKIGADYSHLYDDSYYSMNPVDGIPYQIEQDMRELKLFADRILEKESEND